MHLEARNESAMPAQVPDVQVILISMAYAGLTSVLVLGLRRVDREALGDWARERADLIAVLAGGLLLVALHRPLLHHHLVVLAWPLALLAAVHGHAGCLPAAMRCSGWRRCWSSHGPCMAATPWTARTARELTAPQRWWRPKPILGRRSSVTSRSSR